MTELRITTHEMPAARLGPVNPLPPLAPPNQPLRPPGEIDERVPAADREGIGDGGISGILPYRYQDDYDRARRPTSFRVAVLENEILRATFLMEHGGRLWSLLHKPTDRELLYVNPVFQPTNVAIRNAWVSGGVEWNLSVRGHATHTCSPVFLARVRGDDGGPVLRMYEWDRIRGVPFQLDFLLPDGSEALFVRARLINPHDREIPMYWWSNIATREAPDIRVLVPTDRAYNHGYRGKLRQVPIPICNGIDVTYATNGPSAGDYFYRIPDGGRPWISELDGSGRGLFQTSTSRLVGRKLFLWGMGPGGRRWQEFLSEPGHPYVELQAGLAWTQSHYVPMPAGAEWSWLEAYGLMEADPAVVHGPDWPAAWRLVEDRIDEMLPEAEMAAKLAWTEPLANRPPEEILQRGSGWGVLERRRRVDAGEPPFCSDALVFDDASLGEDQAPWLQLLEHGELPYREPSDLPGAWMVQTEWRRLLEDSLRDGPSYHWLGWLHLGVMHYHDGDVEAARRAWNKSLELAPSAWAYRNLAVLCNHAGQKAEAANLWVQALKMVPDLVPLAIECCLALVEADRPQETLDLLDALPEAVRRNGRVRTLETRAALAVGQLDRAEAILSGEIELTTVREGEVTLSDLWFALHERRLVEAEGVAIDDELRERVRREFPPPPHLDFRMAVKAAEPAEPPPS